MNGTRRWRSRHESHLHLKMSAMRKSYREIILPWTLCRGFEVCRVEAGEHFTSASTEARSRQDRDTTRSSFRPCSKTTLDNTAACATSSRSEFHLDVFNTSKRKVAASGAPTSTERDETSVTSRSIDATDVTRLGGAIRRSSVEYEKTRTCCRTCTWKIN